ncbi:hypothetical protein A6R68_20812 [Neotoma lepida]|uniref:Uncharacterized protein n=1 Tax=Neotoma lepida TaxID=56216 RepID=A0A1A6HSL4_NEOLE|nr:hypothetical protein A6R68_20812 [Neotoma lepida]
MVKLEGLQHHLANEGQLQALARRRSWGIAALKQILPRSPIHPSLPSFASSNNMRMAPTKWGSKKKGPSAINKVVTREYTISIQKHIHGAFSSLRPSAHLLQELHTGQESERLKIVVDPVQELRYLRIDTWVIGLCTATTPADHPYEMPHVTTGTH